MQLRLLWGFSQSVRLLLHAYALFIDFTAAYIYLD